ncbi:unnamed protein product [Rhizophagus irregularis]|nr:unnamed protein product [Rhizophagus irregularis]
MTSPISKFSNCLFYRNMTPQHCSEVIEDFENAFENEKYCDVIIIAGEDPDIKELRANSFVLRVRSKYRFGSISINSQVFVYRTYRL